MNDEQLESAIIELLYDLHALGKLNANVLDSISRNFKVDAFELCENNGITYDLD